MPRLERESYEQFARGLAAGNMPISCYIAIGGKQDPLAANELAKNKKIKDRAEEIYMQLYPSKYNKNGYTHITDELK